MLASVFLPIVLLFQVSAASPRPSETPKPADPTVSAQKEEPPVVAKHSVRVDGRTLNYTTTTGFLPIRNDRTGEIEARIFYMAYTLDGVADPKTRPLMFSFNGGPGSASVWLHLGTLGPRRVKMLDDGMMPPPPYELVDNDQTWLDKTDMVFIDPVGTGYSRATKQEFASKFFGLRGDIESVGEFVRLYLTRNQRWRSPLFLVGESYGTTRAAGLSEHLFDRGIGLNGILLVSAVMNFQTIRFADNNDLPLVLILPSYAVTAWYHKRLSSEMQAKPVEEIAREAREFAANDFMPSLLRIDSLSAQERSGLLDKYSRLTGLDRDYIDRNNFRIELSKFMKELLRDRRRVVGRLDSRFVGIDRNASGDQPTDDPSMSAIRPPFTAVFNDYVRRELGFSSDIEYFILGGGITSPWNWNTNNEYADTSMPLKDAMAKNPYMKIFVAAGYYDMATPFYAAEYTISALNLDPSLRRNVRFEYYGAGHMMYIEKGSLKKLKDDASAFIADAIQR